MLTEKCSSSTADLFTSKLLGGARSLLVWGLCCLGPRTWPPDLALSTLFQTVGKLWPPQYVIRNGCLFLMYIDFFTPHSNPSSLTHWQKWYPSLFSSLKMTHFYGAKHGLFSSKLSLFHDKTLTFRSKMNPLF